MGVFVVVDVAIIGGGPGASALGSYLSMKGIDCAIFEKANHPRPHVGESLVPSTSRIFNEIGFLETMEREGFVHKPGAAWHPSETSGLHTMVFKDFPLEGVPQDYSYHVERSHFDLLLLKHAQSLGTKVYQGVTVKETLFDDTGTANGVRISLAGQTMDVPAKVVVDASGRNTILGTQLGIKKRDPIFNQFAVHAWYADVDRGPEEVEEFIHIYFLPLNRGWAWQIPTGDNRTSFGVVAEKSYFKECGMSIEDWFDHMVSLNPDLTKALAGATCIREHGAEADYSYTMEQFAGDGWILIGDAARFVDPIFSSGISVAMHSAKYAAEAIEAALKTGDFSRDSWLEYEAQLKSGVDVWYEFILLYYKLLNAFTYFITHKDYKLEILRLLSGDVYERSEVGVLDAMRNLIATVEANPEHLLHGKLGDIPIDFMAQTPERAAVS